MPAARRPLFLVLLLFGCTALAGCTTDDDSEPAALHQASHLIGPDLYSWGDPDFTDPLGAGLSRRVTASFEVPADVHAVGVAFRGSFVWPENSTATLQIRPTDGGEPGAPLLRLNASAGRRDDHGEIHGFWQFRPVLQMQPGTYQVVATGRGYVGHLEFQVHGIHTFTTSINETFRVTDPDDEVEIELFLNGWGRTPTVTLVAPDGARSDVTVLTPDDPTTYRFRPRSGTYHLDADTTGWGGRYVVRVSQ